MLTDSLCLGFVPGPLGFSSFFLLRCLFVCVPLLLVKAPTHAALTLGSHPEQLHFGSKNRWKTSDAIVDDGGGDMLDVVLSQRSHRLDPLILVEGERLHHG